MGFYDVVLKFFKDAFSNFFNDVKKMVEEQLEVLKDEVKGDLKPYLDNPKELYYMLKVEQSVLELADQFDRQPGDERIDFVAIIPEWMEKKVIKYACRKIFYAVVRKIKQELMEKENADAVLKNQARDAEEKAKKEAQAAKAKKAADDAAKKAAAAKAAPAEVAKPE
jgi:predicted nucleotidyltransferase